MIVLIIGLTMLFNSYIILMELILKILHGIKKVEGKPLSQEDFKKFNNR
jgi:hypothetical protein